MPQHPSLRKRDNQAIFLVPLSRVQLFATPWTVAHQAPLSMGFFRQEYWSGLPFPSPGDLPDPGIKPRSHALQADALPSEPPGEAQVKSWKHQTTAFKIHICMNSCRQKENISTISLTCQLIKPLGRTPEGGRWGKMPLVCAWEKGMFTRCSLTQTARHCHLGVFARWLPSPVGTPYTNKSAQV